jgi:N6-adenosine-specific RNA methylase IME4
LHLVTTENRKRKRPPAVDARWREEDVLAGLPLSVECDRAPHAGRRQLEDLLGPPPLWFALAGSGSTMTARCMTNCIFTGGYGLPALGMSASGTTPLGVGSHDRVDSSQRSDGRQSNIAITHQRDRHGATPARQAKDATLITQATEIRMRAERRCGELLREMAERKERDSGKGNRNPTLKSQAATPKLSDLDVTKSQSSRWQQLARLDHDTFEARLKSASAYAYDKIAHRFLKEQKIKCAKERHAKIVEHGCTVDDLVALAESGKRFGVIYADPPWPWDTWRPSGKVCSAPDNHYGTTAIAEIASLPVAALAAENCALLLWCTAPQIAIGTHKTIIEGWGFKPCTFGFDWVKTNADGSLYTGMGYYTRSNSEVCLLAIKGSPLRLATDVREIVMAPVGEHSEKPEETRRRVERLFSGPYLELYARRTVPGWRRWGDEIPRVAFSELMLPGDLSIPSFLRCTTEAGE